MSFNFTILFHIESDRRGGNQIWTHLGFSQILPRSPGRGRPEIQGFFWFVFVFGLCAIVQSIPIRTNQDHLPVSSAN